MIEIRAMTIDDYDQVMDLWLRTPEFGAYPRAYTTDRLAAYLARNPGLSTVAIADGRVIGTVLCGHDGRKGSMYNVTVSSEHRRQGIAKKMLERSQNGLKAEGIRVAFLFTYVSSKEAGEFWASQGWTAAPHVLYHDKVM